MRRLLIGLSVGGLAFAPIPAAAAVTACSPGSFRVCAGADISFSGSTLVMDVWNMNKSAQDADLATRLADYGTATGGYHTITAVGLAHVQGTFTDVAAVYWYKDGGVLTSKTLSKWAAGAESLSNFSVELGSNTTGHQEGIVGCYEIGPGSAEHAQTCESGGFMPYVQFTFTGVSLDPGNSIGADQFVFHSQQVAYPDEATCLAEETDDTKCTNGEWLEANSLKGSVVPEPISMLLLGSGLLGIGGARLRRRRSEEE